MTSTDYNTFLEAHNAKLVEMMDKQFEQLLKAAAKNLRQHEDFKGFTMTILVDMMKGGDGPPPKKATKTKTKKTAKSDDDSSEDSKPEFPKGMTKARWTTCCELLAEREDDQYINVKTAKLVKKNARNKDAYYWRKHFCAPMVDKQVVLWACRNEPTVDEKAEDEAEVEFEALDEEDSEVPVRKAVADDDSDDDEDEPPRRRASKKQEPIDDSDDDEDEPPRRRGSKKQEPIDSSDDEEEEPPRRGAGKGKKAPVDDDSSEDDQPPRCGKGKGKKDKGSTSDDVLGQTSKGEDFTMKDLKALKKAAAKQKANGSYANAETRRSCAKNDRNKKTFQFFKHGYAVPKDNQDLADAIADNW